MAEQQPFDLAAQQLVELLELVSSFSNESAAAQSAVERAAQVLEAEVAAVLLGGRVVYSVGFPAGSIPYDDLLAVALRGRDSVELPRLGFCSAAAAALDGSGQGHLVLVRSGDDPFTGVEWNLLRGMARILDLSLSMLRTMDSLRQRQRLMERLYGIQRSISRRMPLQEVLATVVISVRELLDDDLVGLWLPDPEDPEMLLLAASAGLDEERSNQVWRIPAMEAGATGRTVLTDDLAIVSGQDDDSAVLREIAGGSVQLTMAAPVRENNKLTGSLFTATRSASRRYTGIDQEILLAFAENVSLALTDAKTVSDMNEAYHDSLTGLATRSLFLDRLEDGLDEAELEESRLALLFIDLDRFKQVNDTLGHAAGDMLLVNVAHRIQATLRSGDVAARFGGDEFAVMLRSVTIAQAVAVAERIVGMVEKPYLIAGQDVSVGASIGVALREQGEQDPAQLMRRADAAMYQAKRNGRGRCELYRPEMELAQEQEHRPVDPDLRRALDELVHRAAGA